MNKMRLYLLLTLLTLFCCPNPSVAYTPLRSYTEALFAEPAPPLPAPPNSLHASIQATSNCGVNAGAASVFASGGTAPYTYTWQSSGAGATNVSGATGSSITGLAPGTYSVTVTDHANLHATASTAITTVTPNIAVSHDTAICIGGSAHLLASGANLYSWSPSTGLSDTSIANPVANPTVTTTYTVTGFTNTGDLVFNGDFSAGNAGFTSAYSYVSPADNAAANGGGLYPEGVYAVDVNANAYHPQFFGHGHTSGNGNDNFMIINGAPDPNVVVWTETVNNILPNTTYYFTAYVSSMNLITSYANLKFSINGNLIGPIIASPVDTNHWIQFYVPWNSGSNATAVISIVNENTIRFGNDFGLDDISFTTVCPATAQVTVTVNQLPTADAGPDQFICLGTSATLTATGAGVNGTYLWSTGETTASISVSPTATTTYNVTVTTAGGCSASDSVTVSLSSNPLSVHTSSNPVNCYGEGSGTVTALAVGGAGGYHYLWSTGDTVPHVSNLHSDVYYLTVSDAAGCSITATDTVIEPGQLIAFCTGQNGTCQNGNTAGISIRLMSGFGFAEILTYTWSNGDTTNMPTLTGLPAGTYSVTITNSAGCTTSCSSTVTTQPVPTVTVDSTTNELCFGGHTGAIAVSASGGTPTYTYAWDNNASGANIGNLGAGTYTVIVTDDNGCKDTASATITQPTQVTSSVTNTTDVPCAGNTTGTATVTASGGTGAFTYLWVNGQTTATATGLAAGTYGVTVTDANGCAASSSATINGPTTPLTASASATDVLCFGRSTGTATVVASGGSGGYSYSWNNGRVSAAITGLPVGTYNVTVTDGNGCVAIASATVNGPSSAVSVTASATNVLCYGDQTGTGTAVATGGAGTYTYQWDGGQTTATATGLTAGNYGVTVTDANGCRAASSAIVNGPAAVLKANANATDVLCYGATTGTATVVATGGTGTYTYLWTGGQTIATATGLVAGTYGVTVTDANGCVASSSASVNGPAAGVSATITSTPTACFGTSVGTATVTPAGGTGAYTYLWDGGQTTSTASGLAAGTYSVTVTDANGCAYSTSATVSGPANGVSATASATDILCFGNTTGTATVAPSGGSGTYTFAWDGGQTTATATGLGAGTYGVTVTDGNGCAYSTSATVHGPSAAVSATASATDVLCFGASTGTATVTPAGGTGAYTYLWTGGQTTATATSLGAGTYGVTVTDANGCVYSTSATVNGPQSPVSATTTNTNTTCNATGSGTATVNPTGGTGAYTYLWDGGQTTQTATGLTAGTYGVTVTDANGCVTTSSATITGPTSAPSATASATDILCFGNTIATATVNPTGGTGTYTYAWDNGQTTATATGLGAGTYHVTVTDGNGCQASASATVHGPSAPLAVTCTPEDGTCANNKIASISTNVTGGTAASYAWDNGATTASISGLTAGTYNVTVTDANGCIANCGSTVTVITCCPMTDGGQIGVDQSHCGPFSPDTIRSIVAPSGGVGAVEYLWLWNTVNVPNYGNNGWTVIPGAHDAFLVPGLVTQTTYFLRCSRRAGCPNFIGGESNNVAIIVNAVPAITCVPQDGNCTNNNIASVSVNVNSGNITSYAWDNGAVTASISGLVAGTYGVTATDANGCTTSCSSTVAITPCCPMTDGGQIGVDQSHCGPFSPDTIRSIVAPSGGVGAVEYLWLWNTVNVPNYGNNGWTVIPGAHDAFLVPGLVTQTTYFLRCSRRAGCPNFIGGESNNVAIIVNAVPAITCVPQDGNCTNNNIASVSVNVNSGNITSFAWDNGAVTASISGVVAGTYGVTATDANGCSTSCSSTVAITPCCPMTDGGQIGVDQSHCGPFSPDTIRSIVAPSGGVGAVEYLWLWNTVNVPNYGNNGWTVIPGAHDAFLVPGLVTQTTYFLRCSRRAGCPNFIGGESNNVAIIVNPVPTVGISLVTDVNCASNNTGSVTASAGNGTPGYNYTWSNGGVTANINGLAAGTYVVTATDANGCAAVDSIRLSCQSFNLSVTPSPVTCNGLANGSITLTVIGGTSPYTFLWNDGVTTQNRTGLSGGTYSVTVTDAHGLVASTSATVTEPAPCVVTVTGTNLACNGGNNGTAAAHASGGTPPYTYTWNVAGTTDSLSGLPAGSYAVTVTDVNNCASHDSVRLTQPTAIIASGVATNVGCNGGNNGTITTTVSGGTGAFTYLWNDGSTDANRTGLAAGAYAATVTDANGCTAVINDTVTQPLLPVHAHVCVINATCNGGNTGSAVAAVSGGTAPYTFLWSNGATTMNISSLASGPYTVTVTDANGCVQTATGTVINTTPNIVVSNDTAICAGGSAQLSASGADLYLWSPADGLSNTTIANPVATPTATTTYTVTATTHTGNLVANGDFELGNGGFTSGYGFESAAANAASGGFGLYPEGLYAVDTAAHEYHPNFWGHDHTSGHGSFMIINGAVSPNTVIWNESVSNIVPNTDYFFSTWISSLNDISAYANLDFRINGNPIGPVISSPADTSHWVQFTATWNSGASTTANIAIVNQNTIASGNDFGLDDISFITGCSVNKSVTVTVNPIPVADAGPDQNVCGTGSSATLTATGAGANGTYAWSTGETTATITVNPTATTTYHVTVTTASGCSSSDSVTVHISSNPLNATASSTTLNCFGDHSATASVSVQGGTAPFTYAWTGGATTDHINGIGAGTYGVTVTDALGCQSTSSTTVVDPAAVTATASATDILCFGQTTGTATVVPGGGNGTYTYLWTGGQTTATATGLAAGTYSVTVTDGNGCAYATSATVHGPSAGVLATASATDILCFGNTTGTATVVPSGGTGAYTYLWTGGQTTATATGLGVGTYGVTVTDANGCAYSTSATVHGPTAVTATTSSTPAACFGNATGTATVTPSGGTGAFTYLWDGGQTTATATGLGAGTYGVTVTDANGCAYSTSATVQGPPNGVSATASATDILCFGNTTGTATVVPAGGNGTYTYLWDGGQTTATATGLGAGTYGVTVTDGNGCAYATSAIVHGPSAVAATASATDVLCFGNTTGTATVVPSGGTGAFTYLWTGGQTTATATGLAAGTYGVTVTDANGCAYSTSATVNGPQSPVSATASATDILCFGNTTGTATVVPTGGTGAFTFAWDGGQTTATATGLAAGTYGVTVTDANGCAYSTSATVHGPSAVSATATATDILCYGATTGTATVTPSGGTGAFTYLWTGGQTTATATGLSAGTYSVTVTDANGCAYSTSATVNGPSAGVSATATATDILCYGATTGTATVVPSGGTGTYTYLWTGGQTTATATGLSAGTYSVTVTDANGCAYSTSATVNGPSAPVSATASATDVLCYGATTGSATVVPSGGTGAYTYLWTGGQTTATATGLAVGTYGVTVTDANGCAYSTSATVNGPANPLAATTSNTNATCSAPASGTATVNPTGGTGAYTYLWTGGQTTATATGLAVGTYGVTITDANGCVYATSATLSGPSSAPQATATATDVLCFGATTGTATANATSGDGNYTYLWTGGQTTATATGLGAGTYNVTVTDGNGCQATASATVHGPSAPVSVTASETNILCNGNQTGSATAVPAGGTGTYTYLWTGGQTTATATGLAAGSYVVTVTDANGCAAVDSARLTQPTAIVASSTSTNALCNGGNNGSITTTVSGGTTAYSYLWNDGATSANRTNLSAGAYAATVTDANGCTAIINDTVTQPLLPVHAHVCVINSTCNGGNTGSAVAAVSGGTAPYTYLWSNGATTMNIANLASGPYTVTVTDANGCVQTATGTVINTTPNIVVSNDTGICAGGSAQLTASGADLYSWSPVDGLSNTTIANPVATPTATTTYTVTATTHTGNLVANGDFSLGNGGFTSGYGFESAAANAASGGYGLYPEGLYAVDSNANNYHPDFFGHDHTTGNGNFMIVNGAVSPNVVVWSETVNNVVPNTDYYFSAWISSMNDISAYANLDFSINGNPIGPVISSPADTNHWVQFTATWNSGNSTSANIAIVNQDIIASGNDFGLDDITFITGCSVNKSVTVTVNPIPVADAGPDQNVCGTGSSATLTATGAGANGTYAWSTGETTATITVNPTATTTYHVTVTTASGCSSSDSVTVTLSTNPLTATASSTTLNCNGDQSASASVSVQGGTAPFTYAWNGGSTADHLSGLGAGTYSVTVIDALGCQSTSSTTVVNPAAVTATASATDILCFGNTTGTATVVPGGGNGTYTYLWTGGQTTATATGLAAGTYSVTVTDANGCAYSTSATVNGPSAPVSATASATDILCFGATAGTATVTPSGGTGAYTYLWTGGQTTATATGLAVGTYGVTVTDANGCVYSTSATVNGPASPLAATTTSTPATCSAPASGTATVNPTGGTGAYSYLWTGGQTTATATGLAVGSYGVTVTDANGCAYATSATVTGPTSSPQATATATDILCYGATTGTATVNPTGGTNTYTYLWTGGQTTATATGLGAGTYSVTVTDGNGCQATASATVHGPAAAVSATASATDILCFGATTASATVVPSGGTGAYTYLWTGGQTTATATGLGAGTYGVTVTDANGCAYSTSATVHGPAAGVTATASATDILCFGNTTATATVVPSGGSGHYTYLWTGGQTTATATGLGAGTYNVTVTDGSGCSYVTSATVHGPSSPVSATASATDILCFGNTTGTATAVPSGGTGAYTYLWTGGQTTATATGLAAGTYTVTVTDANGCATTANATVHGPSAALHVSTTNHTDVLCYGNATGTATVTPSGGTPAYTYLWPNGQTTATATGLAVGSYRVTVTDAHGCVATENATIGGPANPVAATATGSNLLCYGNTNGTATVTPSGGTGAYTYLWTGGQTTATATGLAAGTYSVTVTDANHCSIVKTATVSGPTNPLAANATGSTLLCFGNTNGTASVSASGGTSSYTYHWTGGQTTSSISGLGAGSYNVTVTDANGCSIVKTAVVSGPANPLTATISCSNVACFGGTSTATVVPSGGTGSYTYLWSNGQTTATATGLTAGSYNVTVTDANGCNVVKTTTVNGPTNALNATITGVNPTCNGGSNGSVTVTPTGGTTPYTYHWNNNASTASITNVAAGTYTVTVTDAGGCTKVVSKTLTQPSAINVTLTCSNATCPGSNNGSINTIVSGGTGAYTYLWSNGQTGANLTNAAAGSYSVTVTDANHCNAVAYGTVTALPGVTPSVTIVPASVNICSGSNVTFTATAVNGGTSPQYQWKLNGSNVGTGSTYSNSALHDGDIVYVVLTSNAACASPATATSNRDTVHVTTKITPGTITGTLSVCKGSCYTYTVPAVAGATSYIWTLPSNATGTSTTNSITVCYNSSFCGGSLCVKAVSACGNSNSSCTNIQINNTTPSAPGSITGTLTPCTGSTVTYSVAAVSGATQYDWTVSNGMIILAGQGTTSIIVKFNSGFSSGTISVKASNCAGSSCGSSSICVHSNAPAPTCLNGPTTVCVNGTYTYTAGAVSGATSYTWTVPANATIVSGQGTTTLSVKFLSGFASGTISVVVNGACGTSSATNIDVYSGPSAPTCINGPSSVCSNSCNATTQTYYVSAVSGVTYTWHVPSTATIISGQGTATLKVRWGSSAGSICVTASNSCGTSASVCKSVCLVNCKDDGTVIEDSTSVTTAIPNAANDHTIFEVYPNPAHDVVTIQFHANGEDKFKMEMFDAKGQQVSMMEGNSTAGKNTLTMNVSEFAKGVYIVKLTSGDDHQEVKIFKQ